MGININDCTQDFTGQILRGEKTIETRSTRSLDPYIGERVGLVRTGVGKATLVGYATVGEPVVYDSVAKFRRDYDKHLVAPGSAFDMKDRLKYGYPLMQVEAVEAREIESRGIVARKVNPVTDDSEYLDAVSRGDMKTAQRLMDAAAKVAGYITKGFHRTAKAFTKFIPGGPGGETQIWRTKLGEMRTLFGPSGRAMWFGSSPDNLPAYHNDPTGKGVILKVLLKNPTPLQIDDDTRDWARDVYADGSKEFPLLLSDEHIRNIRGDGYTGIEYWRKGKTAEKSSPDEMVVFDPSQIKSADPVTYDDAGNVIPVSQRFSDQSDDIRNPYTRPDLRDRLKRKIMAGSKGGNPGQWSARKAQLLAAEYEKAGGGYTGGRSKSQQSLSRWSKQDWRTKSGKPSLETGERYLPAAAIKKLSSAEYAATSRAKRKATGQFSKQPKRIAMKTKEFRNPMTNTVRKKLASVIEPDDRILCYDTASGEDFYRLWDIIHTNMPMTKEALVEVEGMLDDDGVLVIESGESPAGLQDHFRKATRYNGLLLVQGPRNPENARIETEKLRRELE